MIARCSQPEVGWLGWRSPQDEYLIGAIADACAFDKGRNTVMDNLDDFQTDGTPPTANGDKEIPSSKVSISALKNIVAMLWKLKMAA